jgi:hypothetical protein
MQQLSHILSRLVVLFPCLLLAGGCAIDYPRTATQGSGSQGTGTQGTTTCIGNCTPYITLGTYAVGVKPGVSVPFSAAVNNASDNSVIWSIKEGPAGGTITGDGLYTAPAVEGVYHVIATSKAIASLTATATIGVTATEFTVVAKMPTARYGSTASLLPSGQVFIAGGSNDYDFADPAELYDPVAGTLSGAGLVGRWGHTATVLANGDVLLAGGDTLSNATFGTSNTADLRKAGSGAIQPTGSMNSPRSYHSATLLQDGRVLLAGGATTNSGSTYKPMQTAEVYDPATGKFASAGDMATPRWAHFAVLLPNGRVLIVGGRAAGAELYDPATNTFLPAPGVSANRCYTIATLLSDGRVLVAGGSDCSNAILDTAEIYDPSTGQSTPTGNLAIAQSFSAAVLLPDGRVMLVGGSYSVVSQIYDPTTDSFTFGPHTVSPGSGQTATLLPDGSVLTTGDDVEIYK